MRSDRILVRSVLLVVASTYALALGACAGTLEDPSAFVVAEANAADAGACGNVEALLVARCALSGCHGLQSPAASLDLSLPDPRARLSGEPASGGGILVVPGDPAKSVLYLKLTSSPPFGARMPYGSSLDDASIACVHDWIAAGH